MTAPRLDTAPSLDDLARQYGIGSDIARPSTPSVSGRQRATAPSLDDLATQYGVGTSTTPAAVANIDLGAHDDLARRATDLLTATQKGGVAPIQSDATHVTVQPRLSARVVARETRAPQPASQSALGVTNTGVRDASKIYEKNGHPVYDTALPDADGHVPTYRVDATSGRLPNETWEAYQTRVLAKTSFSPDTARVSDVSALDHDVQPHVQALLAAARLAGHPLTVGETRRSQDRQEMLFQKGRTAPGSVVTWTLTSDHTPGRAVDLDGDASAHQWLQQNAKGFGFSTMGAMDPGHVAMPAPAVQPTSHFQGRLAVPLRTPAAPRDATNFDVSLSDRLQRGVTAPHAYSPGDAINDLSEGLGQVVEGVRHPIKTSFGIVSQAVRSAFETFDTPVVGERVTFAQAVGGKGGYAPGTLHSLPEGTIITKENTPNAITPEEFARSGLNTVANVALPLIPGGVAVRVGANAALGALNDPEKPLRGAAAAAGLGELMHAAASKGPAAIEAVKAQFADHPLSKIVPTIPEAHAKAIESALTSNGTQQNGPGVTGGIPGAWSTERGAEGQHGAAAAVPGRIAEVPTSSLSADPARFQFKQNVDEQGVGRELKSVEQYNPTLAGVLSVWKDPTDGRTYVVNGHHRFDLAQRTGQPNVAVQYLDAATPAEARAQGALVNIAEGRGTPLDAAQFFRDSNLGLDDLKAQGVSLSGAIAKNGVALSKLDPSVFDRVARGQLAETHGALIGTMLDRPDQQIAAAQLVEDAARTPSNAEVAEIAKQVKAAGSVEGTQESMFGAEHFSRSLIHERAAIAAELQKRMASDKRLFSYVGQEGRASDLARAGNTINVDASKQLGNQSAALLEGFNREAYASGPVGRMITEAAQRVANGEKPKAVASELYPAIRDAVHASISGSGAAHGSALEGPGAGGQSEGGYNPTGRQVADDAAREGQEQGRLADSHDPAQDALFNPVSRARTAQPSLESLAEQYGVAHDQAAPSGSATLDDLAEHYGVGESLASPARDLFGNVHETGDEQTGMFTSREGTPSARSLKETEAAARSELDSLRQHLELVRDPAERQRLASRVAQLEKLVNRDRAITPEELSTRAAAEASERSGPRALALEDGPTQGILLSPASQPTPTGAAWRRTLGLNAAKADRITALRRISLDLADAVGAPIHEGRGNLKRMRALGAFWTKSEVIRVRRLKMVETVSHEIGHFLSKTQGIKDLLKLSTKGDRVAMKTELVAAGKRLYGTRKPSGGYGEEGIAEWAKFRITDPNRMTAEFPAFAPFAESILGRNPALKVAMDKAQADFARYQASPANARLRSMIATKLPSRFSINPNDIVDYAFDDLAAFRRAADDLGTTNDPNRNAYTLARLTKGNPGRAKDIIDHGVTDFNNAGATRLTRGLPEILHDVAKEREAFTEYFVARQVLTKTAQGIDTGFDVPAAREVVTNGDRNPAFVKTAEELWDFRQKLLKMRVEAGMLTSEEFDAIAEKNPTPTPFYRAFDAGDRVTPGGTRAGKALAKNSSGVHALKGSDRPILDPIESIISDAYDTVDAAHKHYAASVLIKSALTTDGGGRIAELLPEAPQTRVAIPMNRAAEQLIDAGWTPPDPANAALAQGAADGMLQAFYQKPTIGGREVQDMVMPILLNGERKWVQINDRALWDAVQGMSKPELGILGKILGAPTRMLRLGATQFNPDFALTNPLRDAYDAAVYSQGGVRPPFYHLFRGLFHIARERFGDGDELYNRWAQEGGGNAGLVGSDRRALRSEYHKLLREVRGNQSVGAAVLNRIKHPIGLAREFFETFENATRLGEFGLVRDKLTKQGQSERLASRQAALASRDVTLDFSKAGRTVRAVNQYVPFLAAHMADIEKLAREHNPLNLKTSEGRVRMAQVVGRATAYITLPSIALYLAQRNDPDYQEIPEYVKAMAWVIVDHEHGPVPIALSSGKRTRIWVIPRPHLLGFVYGYLPEKTLSWIDKHDPHALDHTASQTVQAMTPPWVPTFAAPLIEAWSNKSTFTGNPIIPESKLGLTKPEQVQAHTGDLARLLGRYTNQSPAMIEQLARDYTGGAGMAANDVANIGIRSARDRLSLPPLAPENTPPVDPLKRVPVLRRFVMDRPSSNAASVQDVYSHYDDAEAKRQTWHRYLAKGDTRQAAQFFAENKDAIASVASSADAGVPGPLHDLHKQMLDVQKDITLVQGAPGLSPLQKATKVRQLQDELVRLARTYTHPSTGHLR